MRKQYISIKNRNGLIIGGYNEYYYDNDDEEYYYNNKGNQYIIPKQNKEIKNMSSGYYIKDGHEYIKVFRRKIPAENQQCIKQDEEYYYYSNYYSWRNYTKFHIGDVILFNNGLDYSNPVGLGELSVIANITLQFNENGIWHEVKNKNISFVEYSYDSFEVYYQAIRSNGSLIYFDPIKCFATLDNIDKYFNELLERKKKIDIYTAKIIEIEKERDTYCDNLTDFKIDGSYDMLYVQPYKGDERSIK